MLRYVFTNNKESGDAFNTGGLTDTSARGSSFTSDQELSGSLTTLYGSRGVGDLRFQFATSRTYAAHQRFGRAGNRYRRIGQLW